MCFVQRVKARGSEENYGVLNAFAAKAGERLGIFRKDANKPPVWTVQETGIFVSEGGMSYPRGPRPREGGPGSLSVIAKLESAYDSR
jgi:hypothetical protein